MINQCNFMGKVTKFKEIPGKGAKLNLFVVADKRKVYVDLNVWSREALKFGEDSVGKVCMVQGARYESWKDDSTNKWFNGFSCSGYNVSFPEFSESDTPPVPQEKAGTDSSTPF